MCIDNGEYGYEDILNFVQEILFTTSYEIVPAGDVGRKMHFCRHTTFRASAPHPPPPPNNGVMFGSTVHQATFTSWV